MNFAMMLLLAAAACAAVLIMSKIPPTTGSYFDPDWITASMSAVVMVVVIYAAGWLYQMLRVFERILLILTGVEPEQAQYLFQGTLRQMRGLFKEATNGR